MKKLIVYVLMLPLVFSVGCIKNDHKIFNGQEVVEFDATVLNSPTLGVTFPLMTRVPAYGAAATTSNPLIARTSGVIKFRVNLVGRHSSSNQNMTYKIVTADFSSVLDIPSGTGARLPAVSGTHFTATGTYMIPAGSSFGEVEITILNPGTSSTTQRYLVIELEGNGTFGASANFKRMGIQISQS